MPHSISAVLLKIVFVESGIRSLRSRTVPRETRQWSGLTLVLRMGATDKILQVSVSLVVQILMDTDLRCVVTINGQTLDGNKEALLNRPGIVLVLADCFEQSDLLGGVCSDEGS